MKIVSFLIAALAAIASPAAAGQGEPPAIPQPTIPTIEPHATTGRQSSLLREGLLPYAPPARPHSLIYDTRQMRRYMRRLRRET